MRAHLAIIVALCLAPTDAFAQPEIAPSEILDIAISGVGSPYVWGGGCWDPSDRDRLGADCSGYVGKVWQVPERSAVTTCSHPYSTYNFYNESTHWDAVDRGDAQSVDAFVYNNGSSGHIVLFASGDPWGNSDVYEARGSAYGIVHRTRTFDSSYRVRRRRNLIADGPPPHPVFVLSTAIDTIDEQGRDLCTRSGSEGLFDVFAGQELTERLYISNEGSAVARDVVVGIEVTSTALHVGHYEIFDDWAGNNCGAEWCPNDANDLAENPAHDAPGSSFFLHLSALSPDETKMIVLELTALEATLSDGTHPEVRLWVRSVPDYYSKDSFDSGFDNVEDYQTFNGGNLRTAVGQTVLGDELCNGMDDNCDGQVDEGYNVGQPCDVGLGECSVDGVNICMGGDVVCDGIAGGGIEEICDNGTDDDCDGLIDELCDPDDHGDTTSPNDPTDSTSPPIQSGRPGTGRIFHESLGMTGGTSCRAAPSSTSEGAPMMGLLLLVFALVRRISTSRS